MKSVMLSIKPKWCEMIARGQKTIEVRKSRPKLEVPFLCYIYCTKDKGISFWTGKRYAYADDGSHNLFDVCGNGKVIGEFVCDYFLKITPDTYGQREYFISDDDLNASCLTTNDLWEYGSGKTLYGWHISALVIYDVPRELSEFVVNDKMAIKTCRHRIRWGQPESVTQHGGWIKGGYCCTRYSEPVSCEPVFCENYITKPVSRPPQSWCYVEEKK